MAGANGVSGASLAGCPPVRRPTFTPGKRGALLGDESVEPLVKGMWLAWAVAEARCQAPGGQPGGQTWGRNRGLGPAGRAAAR